MQIIEANFARGYDPVQYCWPTARNPVIYDELWLYASNHPLTLSVVKLARAKILQSLLDLGSKNSKPQYTAWRNEAFNWIFSDQSDFRAFCSDAGYLPSMVRCKAKEIMSHGLHWRVAAGDGPRYREYKTRLTA